MSNGLAGRNRDIHVVLLGDSVFDNRRYINDDIDVCAQVNQVLHSAPPSPSPSSSSSSSSSCGFATTTSSSLTTTTTEGDAEASTAATERRATSVAVDGAVVSSVEEAQVGRVPGDATHLVLSAGGNDALRGFGVLEVRVSTVQDALISLAKVVAKFRNAYVALVTELVTKGHPLCLCTVYKPCFGKFQPGFNFFGAVAPAVPDASTVKPKKHTEAAPAIDKALLDQLTNMGFPEPQSKIALKMCSFNVEEALELLCTGIVPETESSDSEDSDNEAPIVQHPDDGAEESPFAAIDTVSGMALSAINGVILDAACHFGLPVICLDKIMTDPADFANQIEPSSVGGMKMAQIIVRVVTSHNFAEGKTTLYH
ncbi:hypothetical protein Pelo_6388 [Pelomyxa schiedti]|nr:hypothetical protein Pelo_6388 [Pelomyxa schiedti]